VVHRCGVNAGPLVFVPACDAPCALSAAQCALSRGQCHYREACQFKYVPDHLLKWRIVKAKCPLSDGCDQKHTHSQNRKRRASQPGPNGQRSGASASSLDSNDPCMPGPAATTAASPGAALFRPLTSAPASVAMIQPAARSHGFRPAS
jgi:hypothetical protein